MMRYQKFAYQIYQGRTWEPESISRVHKKKQMKIPEKVSKAQYLHKFMPDK